MPARAMSSPSILHIGDIAGVPQELSRAQRRMGYKSDVMAFQSHPFEYEIDIFRPTRLPFPLRYAERLLSLSRLVGEYDVLHFHWSSLVPFGFDLPLWKRLGKRIIIHWHGDDVRNKGEGRLYSRFADRTLVSTPDLLQWSPKAQWLPNPIDLRRFPFVGLQKHAGPVRILHAPSMRAAKGTAQIIDTVAELKREGYEIDLMLIENMPHERAMQAYREADIAIDQLLIGWYGVFAVECMALGKPACVYIRDDLKKYIEGTPLVNASPSTLKQRLIELIENEELRREMGINGRRYVERVHDADVVCGRMMKEVYG